MMIKSNSLEKLAAEYGVRNLRFFIQMQPSESLTGLGIPLGMTSSSSPWVNVECEVDEERYQVADGYKITLKPVEQKLIDNRWYFASESFYQQDLENMLRRHPDSTRAFVLVDSDAKYEPVDFSW